MAALTTAASTSSACRRCRPTRQRLVSRSATSARPNARGHEAVADEVRERRAREDEIPVRVLAAQRPRTERGRRDAGQPDGPFVRSIQLMLTSEMDARES